MARFQGPRRSTARQPRPPVLATVPRVTRPLIALDADGVLLDFHLGYAGAWERAFGAAPAERDPLAYWPIDRWLVERLDDDRRAHFRRHFDADFWASVPAIEGALAACHRLHDAGFDLVCVSALDAEHEAARLRNLRDHGFPIEQVRQACGFD